MAESNLLVKERDVVVPGEVLAEGMDYLPGNGTYRAGNQIIAMQLGLVSINNRFVKVIALSGKYQAVEGDLVIGKVYDITMGAWLIDIGGAYTAALALRETPEFIERGADLTRYYDFGDVLIVKVVNVVKGKGVDLTVKGPGLRKIIGGRIMEVTPSKVPRIIGKQGSMISLIKEKTGCMVVVGQNGRVWIKGEHTDDEVRAAEAILKIEQESHTGGLTDKITALLSNKGSQRLPYQPSATMDKGSQRLPYQPSATTDKGAQRNPFEKSVDGKEPSATTRHEAHAQRGGKHDK